jgi:hypothetical protein
MEPPWNGPARAFILDGESPTETVMAAYSKRRRDDAQPLPRIPADRLRPWLAAKAPGRPVFGKLTKHTAEMLRVDLEAAGIPYETASGVADFHAFRVAYVTHLVSSGASVKTCQTLARHSTPSLTIGVYAKASLHDIKGAVDNLPDLTSTAHRPTNLAATGTDGRLSHYFPTAGDVSGRDMSVPDVMTDLNARTLTSDSSPRDKASDAAGWVLTHTGIAEGVGFEPTDSFHYQRFSRPSRSTTLAPLLSEATLAAGSRG